MVMIGFTMSFLISSACSFCPGNYPNSESQELFRLIQDALLKGWMGVQVLSGMVI